MTTHAIKVENLSKRYIIGHQGDRREGLRHVIERNLTAPYRWARNGFRADPKTREEFWAIRDVSFEVTPGEVVGIIGRNGAGKSTLLKLLSRITEQTEGRIRLHGRLASLLEVGTGFHPELSGRENIYLNGAILGMTRLEIKRKFDEIVAFAEVEKFLDTPVKRYSSGMYVRLAFAVAAHLEPEILVVDEVLAVGDIDFQKKCLGKMGEVSKQGRTVLFVSHNMGTVRALCERVIHLNRGSIVNDGPADDVVAGFLGEAAAGRVETVTSDDGAVSVHAVEAYSASGEPREEFIINEPVRLEMEFEVHGAATGFYNPVIELYDAMGNILLSATNFVERDWHARKPTPPGRYRTRCVVPPDLLNASVFYVTVMMVHNFLDAPIHLERVLQLHMIESGEHLDIYNGPINGVIRPRCDWRTEAVGATTEPVAAGARGGTA